MQKRQTTWKCIWFYCKYHNKRRIVHFYILLPFDIWRYGNQTKFTVNKNVWHAYIYNIKNLHGVEIYTQQPHIRIIKSKLSLHVDGSQQDCGNSTADALELPQSCTKSSMWSRWPMHFVPLRSIWTFSFLFLMLLRKWSMETHGVRDIRKNYRSKYGGQGAWKKIFHTPLLYNVSVNTQRPRQHGWHFADDIFKSIFLYEIIVFFIQISSE